MDSLTPMIRNRLIISRGTHLGFNWVVTFNRETEYWCGYMKVPVSHPWFELPLYEIDELIHVHGGLTFGGGRDFDEDDPDGHWIGFASQSPQDSFYFFNQEWTEGQCRSMCEQVNAVLPCIDVEVGTSAVRGSPKD